MRRWSIVFVALFVYGVVLCCVMWPGSNSIAQRPAQTGLSSRPATIQSREGLPLCGAVIQVQRTDWIERYKQCIDEVAALGVDTVMLVVHARQETVRSTFIFLDMRITPTPDALADLIKHAKSKKLRVILMPLVLLQSPIGQDWRGRIEPQAEYGGWDQWFESYRGMLNHFSWIAEAHGVDVFVVGSEYISAEPHVEEGSRRSPRSAKATMGG